ncbi:GNAT family N-acetyltransferase [Deinococcus hopiensis]|uniref:N-acetylglutamate synthase, GNAT family n=1 Tax=Deinococcus hopiensis KR-140 TaxID=695939 RepID=A0A1W1VCB1_9DEIO|nr:GNAT family N-acetyltransferase [Deinococcus hopiensis]SMB91097.1 N-acetylglutamate synthase, GNAT family [Deinococcus hopiensis KR-140]
MTHLDSTRGEFTFGPLHTLEDIRAFRTLNEEWITRLFSLEAADERTLGDPQGQILDRGGQVYMAWRGQEPVGCVALLPMGEGVFEVSKMAVAPTLRGQGVGRRLLSYALNEARSLGARRLFLGSSTRLPAAVHLYESLGFRHLPPERRPQLPYARADVFMELPLERA